MHDLFRDARFAFRALLRAPLLLITAIVTLALGIGLSTGVFAVAYGVLLRPLPYQDPSRLVVITMQWASRGGDARMTLDDVEQWQRRARAFERVAAYSTAEFTLRGIGEPRTAQATMVTDGFFETLGVAAAEGSTSGVSGASTVAVFGARLADQAGRSGQWRQRGLTIGASHFDVAGVMPRDFRFPTEDAEFWLPAHAVPKIAFLKQADMRPFRVIARLAAGVTLAQAQDDAARVAGEISEGQPEGRRRRAIVTPLAEHVRGDARAAVAPFVAGSLLVLLIACANVSGLLVGRASTRGREVAVRRALGGGTAHVLRASIAESGSIALAGWALGIWVAWLVVRGFQVFGAEAIPNLHAVRLDAASAAASLALAALVGVASGAAPAIRALRSDSGGVLKGSSERIGRRAGAAQGALVLAQIALTVVLLVSAGLLTRTVMHIIAAERGFDPRQGLAIRLMLSETVSFNVASRAPFVERLLADVRALPGVMAAGVSSDLPPNGTQLEMTIRVQQDETASETFALGLSPVTTGYLEAIGAELLAGRFFDERDRVATVPTVVITESAARRATQFLKREAVGGEWLATIPTPQGNVKPIVIGVVRDVKFGGLDRDAPPAIFVPWERVPLSQSYLVVRTKGAPGAAAGAIREAIRRLDPAMPMFPPRTLEEVMSESIAERRLRLRLGIVFAALALLLAAVALWGTVAQSVVDRRRELAIRLALGSTDAGAVRLMLRGGIILIAGGLAAGTLGAGLSARALQHLLHGVRPLDPLTFAGGIGVAAAVSLLACYLPARRAASISPAELLREG